TPVASATITRGTVAQVSPAASPADTGTQSRNDLWARMKERGHYWILLAQLNPIPVAIGAEILILIIGLLLVQRRRAKKTRRVRPLKPTAYEPVTEPPPQNLRAAAAPEPKPKPDASIPLAAAAAVAVTDTTTATKPARVATPAPASLVDDARREHVNRVADEARKLFDGEQYNR